VSPHRWSTHSHATSEARTVGLKRPQVHTNAVWPQRNEDININVTESYTVSVTGCRYLYKTGNCVQMWFYPDSLCFPLKTLSKFILLSKTVPATLQRRCLAWEELRYIPPTLSSPCNWKWVSAQHHALPSFTPGTHWTEGWVGTEAGGGILCLCRESIPGSPVGRQTLHWLSYPAHSFWYRV
jgi:hypothetical protein